MDMGMYGTYGKSDSYHHHHHHHHHNYGFPSQSATTSVGHVSVSSSPELAPIHYYPQTPYASPSASDFLATTPDTKATATITSGGNSNLPTSPCAAAAAYYDSAGSIHSNSEEQQATAIISSENGLSYTNLDAYASSSTYITPDHHTHHLEAYEQHVYDQSRHPSVHHHHHQHHDPTSLHHHHHHQELHHQSSHVHDSEQYQLPQNYLHQHHHHQLQSQSLGEDPLQYARQDYAGQYKEEPSSGTTATSEHGIYQNLQSSRGQTNQQQQHSHHQLTTSQQQTQSSQQRTQVPTYKWMQVKRNVPKPAGRA